METQLYLNILISLIISASVSYYYYRKVNQKSMITFVVLFLLLFVIFYYLGPKNNIESFNSILENVQEEVNSNVQEEDNSNVQEEDNSDVQEEQSDKLTVEENNILNENINIEEENQLAELDSQEEHIRKLLDSEEIEEEDNNDELKKKVAKEKILTPQTNKLGGLIQGNDNQVNPGIGIGVSPVNIYINGDEVEVDKFGNKKRKQEKKQKEKVQEQNYYKQPSRIYNNCDWVYDKNEWCDGTYNYDKNNNDSNNNLLPCVKPNVNKIPQTLNNLIHTKKNNSKSEPCPLDVNKPWSNYQTGDDKETNKIVPEGFNI